MIGADTTTMYTPWSALALATLRRGIVATMVKIEAFRNLPYEQLVNHTVRRFVRGGTSRTDISISVSTSLASPFPTPISDQEFGGQPVEQIHYRSHAWREAASA
jgi:hypothetical protein